MNYVKIATCGILLSAAFLPVAVKADCPGMATVEINECAAIELEKAQNSMKSNYNTLHKSLAAEGRQLLHKSQVAWILYSQDWCMVATSDSKGGTIRNSEITYCLESLTKEREKQLKS